MDDALDSAIHDMQTTFATTLGSNPGALYFIRDMFLNVALVADWKTISRQREHNVNKILHKANAKRLSFD